VRSPLYVQYWQHRRVPSSPTRCRAWQTRYSPRPWRFDDVILVSSSTHHRLHLWRLRATTFWRSLARQRLHVRLPMHRLLRQLCRPQLPYARHHRPWLLALSSVTSTSALRGIICLSNLVGFHSSLSIRGALTIVTREGISLPISLQSHRLRRSRCDCGGMLEYIRHISILGRLGSYPYPTISIGEAPCPLSHVLYIFSTQSHANTIHNSYAIYYSAP